MMHHNHQSFLLSLASKLFNWRSSVTQVFGLNHKIAIKNIPRYFERSQKKQIVVSLFVLFF